MKFVKSSWRTCFVALVSFLMGASLFQTKTVRATPQETGLAHVFIVPVALFDTKSGVPANLPGARVAGISCIAKPTQKSPDAAICYVATAPIE
jgi:hypothetical protein